ncbi:MAG TPA: peptidylprolyl isomerase [Tepidisphaeraceae bacterium]|nr:peptidylprolyl isomerase [Tepidisphaeraceae bacterium]
MQLMSGLAVFFSILIPTKVWFAPTQPLTVNIKSDAAVTLVLTDFAGKPFEAAGATEAAANKEVDIRPMYRELSKSGTYLLFAVAKGKGLAEFVGTPLVIQVRSDKRPGMPDEPIVVKMEPLRYSVMSTDHGDMTWIYYYDIAPNTVSAIQTLSEEGFYEGLTFHRILPGFVIQGGDPHGDGVGGPGFSVDAEFSNVKHEEGILSMARSGDPLEQQGMKPRCEFANSAGSQFFVCLGPVPNLDGKYTAFGKVVEGLDAVKAIAAVPLADKRAGKPEKAPVIKKVTVMAVTAEKNPYAAMLNMGKK